LSSEGETFEVPLVFVGAEDVPVLLGNNFIIQHQQDEFILSVGQFTPPILVGTLEERERVAKEITHLPVKIVARVAMTRQRLVELIEILQTNLKTFDEGHKVTGLGAKGK